MGRDQWIGALQTHISGLNQDDVDFLTEALMNCEPEDWDDILSPFFDENVEQQAARKAEILSDLRKRPVESNGASGSGYADREPSPEKIVKVDPNLENYLFGPIADLLQTKSLLSIADTFRLRATCKLAQRLDKRGLFWRPKAEHFCKLTGKEMDDVRDARKYFFSLVPCLPRFDGIYIGKCITVTAVREGSSLATFLQMEDKTVAAHGVRGSYRRYLRMWPPEIGEDGKCEWPPRGRAMVMMDSGLKGPAGENLLLKANPSTHQNDGDPTLTPPASPRQHHNSPEAAASSAHKAASSGAAGSKDPAGKIDTSLIKKQMFSGWWQIHGEDLQGNILLKIHFVSTSTKNDSTMIMQMCHDGPSHCNLLKWREYTLVSGDYVDEVDLRLDSYGEVLPHQTCHYAPYRLKRFKELEHFL